MIRLLSQGPPPVWEWRVWAPLSRSDEEEPTAAIGLQRFEGTRAELALHLQIEVYECAERGEIGPLMTYASMFVDAFKRGEIDV